MPDAADAEERDRLVAGDCTPGQRVQRHSARLRHRCGFIATLRGNRHAHLRREPGEFGKASVSMNTVEVVVFADVDAAFFAPGALPAPPSCTGNNALADLWVGYFRTSRHNDPYHLVSEDNGTRVTADPVRFVKRNHRRRLVLAGVCPAEGAHLALDDHLCRPRRLWL